MSGLSKSWLFLGVITIILSLVFLVFLLCTLTMENHINCGGLRGVHNFGCTRHKLRKGNVTRGSLATFELTGRGNCKTRLSMRLLDSKGLTIVRSDSLVHAANGGNGVRSLGAGSLGGCALRGAGSGVPFLGRILRLFNNTTPVVIRLGPARGGCTQLYGGTYRLLSHCRNTCYVRDFSPEYVL